MCLVSERELPLLGTESYPGRRIMTTRPDKWTSSLTNIFLEDQDTEFVSMYVFHNSGNTLFIFSHNWSLTISSLQ